MKRVLFLAALSAMLLVNASRAQAGYYTSILVSGVNNTLEDQSREAFIDRNPLGDAPDGVFGVGDVLVGFVRIDNKSPPPGATPNHMYAIFSQQITSFGIFIPGVIAVVNFSPTTAAGLTLSALTGVGPASGIVALYDSVPVFPTDLIATSPGDLTGNGTTNLFDYFKSIKDNGTLQLIAGFGGAASQADDYFKATVTDPAGSVTVALK